jgi:hypothetical protein
MLILLMTYTLAQSSVGVVHHLQLQLLGKAVGLCCGLVAAAGCYGAQCSVLWLQRAAAASKDICDKVNATCRLLGNRLANTNLPGVGAQINASSTLYPLSLQQLANQQQTKVIKTGHGSTVEQQAGYQHCQSCTELCHSQAFATRQPLSGCLPPSVLCELMEAAAVPPSCT